MKKVQISDALTAQNLLQLKKSGYTEKQIRLSVAAIVKSRTQMMNLSLPMTEEQILFFVDEWCAEYYTDTLEDLVIMFRMVLSGKIGKVYNRCDVRTLFEWWSEYMNFKLEEKEKQIQEAKKKKQDPVNPEQASKRDIPEFVKEHFKKFDQKYRKKTPEDDGIVRETMESFLEGLKGKDLKYLKYVRKEYQSRNITGAYNDALEYIEQLIKKAS